MRKLSNNINIKNEEIKVLAVKFSHPKWLLDKWQKEWDSNTVLELITHNNIEPKIYFRINRLKISIKEIYDLLIKRKISFEESDVIDEFFYLV